MNKQKDRYTPFPDRYRMPVNEFCAKYGLSLKVVMHRMNVLYWEDFDSLVIPQELGDTPADRVARTLKLINMGWSDASIVDRMKITPQVLNHIRNMDNYRKDMFLSKMKNYFYLDPEKIDLSQIFTEVDFEKREVV